MHYQTVLFDLDGTLTDPREGITRSIQFALAKLGIDLAPGAFDEALHARFGDFLAALEGKACALP